MLQQDLNQAIAWYTNLETKEQRDLIKIILLLAMVITTLLTSVSPSTSNS